jgi:hypothetical protein
MCRHIPQDCILYTLSSENIKSHITTSFIQGLSCKEYMSACVTPPVNREQLQDQPAVNDVRYW